jgi:hypothetical protein
VEDAVPGPNIDVQSHSNETVLLIASDEQKAPVGSKCNGLEESETGAIKAALEETHGEEQNATRGEEGTHGEEHNAAEGANSNMVEDAAPGPNIDEQSHSKETVHSMTNDEQKDPEGAKSITQEKSDTGANKAKVKAPEGAERNEAEGPNSNGQEEPAPCETIIRQISLEEPAPGETIRQESRKKRRKKRAHTVPPTALYTTSQKNYNGACMLARYVKHQPMDHISVGIVLHISMLCVGFRSKGIVTVMAKEWTVDSAVLAMENRN